MLWILLGTYLTLSLGAGFLMWAMCRMAAVDHAVLELRLDVEPAEGDGLVAPTAVAY